MRGASNGPRRALLSVTNKAGVVDFGRGLADLGFELWSTGGTAGKLREAGLTVRDVSELVGKPLGGDLVKTLSREIAAGLLMDPQDPENCREITENNLGLFEVLCVNFYRLEDELANLESTDESIRRATDVGGPTMAHECAKGRKGGYRVAVTDPADYAQVLEWLRAGKPDAEKFVREFAGKAELAVVRHLLPSAIHLGGGDGLVGRSVPDVVGYGENRWQKLRGTGYFATDDSDPLALHRFHRMEGSAPGVVGATDLSRAVTVAANVAAGFKRNFGDVPAVAIAVKHGNPCGGSVGTSSLEAVTKAVKGDPLAIFGGVIVVNFKIEEAEAEALLRLGTEFKRPIDGVAAPGFSGEAIAMLKRPKTGRCRILVNEALGSLGSIDGLSPRCVPVRGGFIKQDGYGNLLADLVDPYFEWQLIGPELTEQQKQDAILAWAVCLGSNSNTVTITKGGMVIGNGVGQQDRKACCELAVQKALRAGHKLDGAVAWSDSFFPFDDGLKVLTDAGVGVVVASRGSMRDEEVMEHARTAGISFLTAPDAKLRCFSYHTG